MQDKNILISFLQAFGILLVVLGHSCHFAPDDPFWYTWIYSFHMPLFMFISGFLLQYGNERKGISLTDVPLYGRKGFIWKKVKRLLIPYVVISSLAFLPKSLLNRFADRPVEVSFDAYLHQLIYPWENVIKFFWFLPTLFIIFLIIIYGARLLKDLDKPIWHIVLLVLLLLLHLFNPLTGIKILNLEGVVNYLIYFCLGFFCCRYHIIKYLNYNLWFTTLSFALSLIFVVTIGKGVLTAINGIALSILLGRIYLKRQCHFMHHLFGASYAIYLFSWFPQTASQQVFLGITHAPWQIGCALAIISGIYIPWLIYRWIIKNKNTHWGKWIALLTGQ